MNTTQLVENIESLLTELKAEDSKTTKVAKGNARKIARAIREAAEDYRKASMEEEKSK